MGLPTAAAVGAAGMRLPGQPQTGAVLLVSNLNEQVRWLPYSDALPW